LCRIPYSVAMTDGNLIFKSRTEQRIEAEYGLDIADVLRDLYHERGMSQAEMALVLRVHRTTVVDLMKRYAIATGYNKSGTAA
jgi:predicted XRE-type DNA-binding protein